MYNKIILLGFVTKDAELRYLPNGTALCNVTIATNHSYKKDNEWKKETLFMNCTIFGKFAEIISPHLTKGISAYAEGRLQEQRWEADGQRKSKMVAILDTIKTLAPRDKTENKVTEPDNNEPDPF